MTAKGNALESNLLKKVSRVMGGRCVLAPLPGCGEMGGGGPVVSLCSTTG